MPPVTAPSRSPRRERGLRPARSDPVRPVRRRLIFDIVYARSGEPMCVKSAAWLIALGLVFAVIPRLINLVQCGSPRGTPQPAAGRIDFGLNLLAIVAALVNAFVHTRDAYAVVPEGVWLSATTVLLLVIAHLVVNFRTVETRHAVDGKRSVHA